MSIFNFTYKKTILIALFSFATIAAMAQEEPEPVSAFAKKKAANDKNASVKREFFLEKNIGAYKLFKNVIGKRYDKDGLLLNTPVSSHLVLYRGFIANNYYHQFDFVNPDNKFIVPRTGLFLPVLSR